jgi:hypothetical protein
MEQPGSQPDKKEADIRPRTPKSPPTQLFISRPPASQNIGIDLIQVVCSPLAWLGSWSHKQVKYVIFCIFLIS